LLALVTLPLWFPLITKPFCTETEKYELEADATACAKAGAHSSLECVEAKPMCPDLQVAISTGCTAVAPITVADVEYARCVLADDAFGSVDCVISPYLKVCGPGARNVLGWPKRCKYCWPMHSSRNTAIKG
jgi:hypothetical protein